MDVTQVHASAGTVPRPAERSTDDRNTGRAETAKETEKPRKADNKRPEMNTVHAPDLRFRASGSPVEPPVIEVLDSSGEVVRTIPPDSQGEIVNTEA